MNIDDLYNYLQMECRGAANAQPKREIAAAFNIGERRAERMIELLRKKHRKPICSSVDDPKGYFVMTRSEEGRRYLATLKKRRKEMDISIEAVNAKCVELEARERRLKMNEEARQEELCLAEGSR